ncbi:MAG: hypothetical protein LBM01_01000 [Christensenellaceae bacterium]|nr:hypothetical protein [Christensenellaceae bacterium]
MKEITIEDIQGNHEWMTMFNIEFGRAIDELASEDGVITRDDAQKAKNVAYNRVIKKLNAEQAQETEIGL